MRAMLISKERRADWNALAAQEPFFALLHSWEWGEFKQALGWSVFRIVIEDRGQIVAGAQMLTKPLLGHLAGVAYMPRGPIGCWYKPKVSHLLFAEIHSIARRCNCVFLKIEPPVLNSQPYHQLILENDFRRSAYSNQPHSTIVLDISPEPERILGQMRQKTRQYIRAANRDGIEIQIGGRNDLPAFYEMLQATGQREHFVVQRPKYYENEWTIFDREGEVALLMAYKKDQLLAVRTAYRFGKHAAEFHAGSVSNLDKSHANYLLVWEAINWAKQHGCTDYDFWGIPDDVCSPAEQHDSAVDRSDGLWGVYQFKRGFCKNVVSYIGSYDYVYKPFLYRMITNKVLNLQTIEDLTVFKDSMASRWS